MVGSAQALWLPGRADSPPIVFDSRSEKTQHPEAALILAKAESPGHGSQASSSSGSHCSTAAVLAVQGRRYWTVTTTEARVDRATSG